jgi:hypothetical protein
LRAAISLSAGASTLSVSDCFEGSDFIANAALSRENGMSRDDSSIGWKRTFS